MKNIRKHMKTIGKHMKRVFTDKSDETMKIIVKHGKHMKIIRKHMKTMQKHGKTYEKTL